MKLGANVMRAGLWGLLAVLVGGPCITAWALDPVVEDLRAELHRLFPTPAGIRPVSDPAVAANPFAIVHREYLYARPLDLMAPATRVSLSRLREYPPPLLQAHAMCVKVFTPSWHGAGVIVSASGDILTSYHLMAGVVTASVQTIEGRLHPVGSVLAYSAVDDLALVHIEGGPYPALTVRAGDPPAPNAPLFIVGHPGDQSWKLTEGHAIRHCTDGGARVLHFEADIGRGNSGGPVVDAEGRLCAITACAAELADGSKVKVGTAAAAIRDFLATRPGSVLNLPDLAEIERNRQAAGFLELIYEFTEGLLVEWQVAMAQADVETASDLAFEPAPSSVKAPLSARTVSFAHTAPITETAVQLVMLQALMRRCSAAPGLSPELVRSMTHYTAVLDGLLEAAALLSHKTTTPDEARRKLRLAADRQAQAGAQFGTAVAILQEAGKGYGLNTGDSSRYASLEQIRLKYETTGCRTLTAPAG